MARLIGVDAPKDTSRSCCKEGCDERALVGTDRCTAHSEAVQ